MCYGKDKLQKNQLGLTSRTCAGDGAGLIQVLVVCVTSSLNYFIPHFKDLMFMSETVRKKV